MNPDRAAARADELQRRKEARLAELDREAQLASPAAGRRRRGAGHPAGPARPGYSASHADLRPCPGHHRRPSGAPSTPSWPPKHGSATTPEEMPHNNPGYDIRSTHCRRRHCCSSRSRAASRAPTTFCVTRNELRFAANVPDAVSSSRSSRSQPDGAEHDQVRYLARSVCRDVAFATSTRPARLSHWHAYWQRGDPHHWTL